MMLVMTMMIMAPHMVVLLARVHRATARHRRPSALQEHFLLDGLHHLHDDRSHVDGGLQVLVHGTVVRHIGRPMEHHRAGLDDQRCMVDAHRRRWPAHDQRRLVVQHDLRLALVHVRLDAIRRRCGRIAVGMMVMVAVVVVVVLVAAIGVDLDVLVAVSVVVVVVIGYDVDLLVMAVMVIAADDLDLLVAVVMTMVVMVAARCDYLDVLAVVMVMMVAVMMAAVDDLDIVVMAVVMVAAVMVAMAVLLDFDFRRIGQL